jgi:vacuolar-type H+-ATPase subunit H
MSQELYQAVHNAEEAADRIVQEAQQQARDLIKETEAEIKAGERKAALAQRAKYQSILEEKRQAVEKQIEDRRPQADKAQRERLDAARAKLEQAAQMIFERIWNDGDR